MIVIKTVIILNYFLWSNIAIISHDVRARFEEAFVYNLFIDRAANEINIDLIEN